MTSLSEAVKIALAHHRAGRLDLAEEIYARVLAVEPEHADALHLMGAVAQQQGDFRQAAEYAERAIRADGGQAHFYNTLGEAYRGLQRIPEAIACYQRAIQMRPDHGASYNNLGHALEHQLDESMACYQRAIEVQPDLAEAHNNLGNAYDHLGELDAAIDSYRRALQLKPDLRKAYSNYLCTLRNHPQVAGPEIRVAAEGYDRCYARPLRATWREHLNSRDPERRLRLGFVAPNFCLGPVGSFLIRGLEHLDRRRLHVACYATEPRDDRIAARFQHTADTWRECSRLTDEQLAEQIRADEIDILIDLAGHLPLNRLLVFARKPAPIQITWIDSVGTTGLSAIDYVLADDRLIPPEAEPHYVERVLRMPDGYVCYEPPDDAPPVGPLPAAEHGRLTFGSFNRPCKIQPAVINLWARILNRLPDSRLILKQRMFHSAVARRRYVALFAASGVDPARVEYQGFTSRADYFEQYNRIDVTLEPFPHSGGVTTCDSLWMGVPMITCPGETFTSRQPLAHLTNIGFTETIARDPEEYVEIAVRLANDLPRLAGIRESLRQRTAASPLCDGARFAANLEAVLRDVWREWCRRPAAF